MDYTEYTGAVRTEFTALVRAVIAWFVDDLRGLAGPSGGFYAPAQRGACLQCMVQAFKIKATSGTCWPGACKHIFVAQGEFAPQRAAFKRWYAKNPSISAAADGVQARDMSKAFAHRQSLQCMAACQAAGNNESAIKVLQQQYYWKEVDVWSELLDYWGRVEQNINDPAHEIYNMVKALLATIGNIGHHKINAKRRAFSRGLGQTVKRKKAPWQNNVQNQQLVDAIAKAMRLPSAWPKPRYFFDKLARLTVSEVLLYAGPLGVYLFGFIAVENMAVIEAAIRLLFCCEELQAMKHTNVSLNLLEKKLIIALADLENVFPIQWCSQVMHVALHLCTFIRRCGPFREHSMLGFERLHVVIKRLVRGRKNMLASFHNHYEMMVGSSEWRCIADRKDQINAKDGLWRTPGFSSSITGHRADIDYSDKQVRYSGSQQTATLDAADYEEVQDLWSFQHQRYATVRNGYRNGVADQRAQLPASVTTARRHYAGFKDTDEKYLQMTPEVLVTKFATLNTAKFRPARTQHALTTDDSAIKGWYNDPDSDKPFSACFGWIQRMFRHELYPGGESLMIVEAEWLNMRPHDPILDANKLPTGVRVHDRADDDPGPPRFICLKECTPFNIALLPSHPQVRASLEYLVIDRHGKLGEL